MSFYKLTQKECEDSPSVVGIIYGDCDVIARFYKEKGLRISLNYIPSIGDEGQIIGESKEVEYKKVLWLWEEYCVTGDSEEEAKNKIILYNFANLLGYIGEKIRPNKVKVVKCFLKNGVPTLTI